MKTIPNIARLGVVLLSSILVLKIFSNILGNGIFFGILLYIVAAIGIELICLSSRAKKKLGNSKIKFVASAFSWISEKLFTVLMIVIIIAVVALAIAFLGDADVSFLFGSLVGLFSILLNLGIVKKAQYYKTTVLHLVLFALPPIVAALVIWILKVTNSMIVGFVIAAVVLVGFWVLNIFANKDSSSASASAPAASSQNEEPRCCWNCGYHLLTGGTGSVCMKGGETRIVDPNNPDVSASIDYLKTHVCSAYIKYGG